MNCLELSQQDINELLKSVLYEFPIRELDLFLPPWVDALPQEHPIKATLYASIREGASCLHRIRDIEQAMDSFCTCEQVSTAQINSVDLGSGIICASLELPRSLFYRTLS